MKVQLFSDALGAISAEYIDEALTYHRPTKYGTTKTWLKRCVAACLTLVVFFGAMIATSVPLRAAFVGWIKEVYEAYFVYHYENESTSNMKQVEYRPTWLPSGYVEFYVDDTEDTVAVVYANEEGYMLKLSYAYNPNKTIWFVEAEQVEIVPATVNGNPAELLIAKIPETANAIMWIDQNNSAFYISGFFNEDTLIRIAQSVKEVSS